MVYGKLVPKTIVTHPHFSRYCASVALACILDLRRLLDRKRSRKLIFGGLRDSRSHDNVNHRFSAWQAERNGRRLDPPLWCGVLPERLLLDDVHLSSRQV
jgi:hypothetical protein